MIELIRCFVELIHVSLVIHAVYMSYY